MFGVALTDVLIGQDGLRHRLNPGAEILHIHEPLVVVASVRVEVGFDLSLATFTVGTETFGASTCRVLAYK